LFLIQQRINAFADELINSDYQVAIKDARNSVERYSSSVENGYTDLYHFAELVSNDSTINDVPSADDIMSLVNEIVEYEDHYDVEHSHGLSIYLPPLYDPMLPAFYDFHYGIRRQCFFNGMDRRLCFISHAACPLS